MENLFFLFHTVEFAARRSRLQQLCHTVRISSGTWDIISLKILLGSESSRVCSTVLHRLHTVMFLGQNRECSLWCLRMQFWASCQRFFQVLKESFKIYCAINDGIINLVDMVLSENLNFSCWKKAAVLASIFAAKDSCSIPLYSAVLWYVEAWCCQSTQCLQEGRPTGYPIVRFSLRVSN